MLRPYAICTAIAIACAGSAPAQTLTTNAAGQRVIVYPDGSTRLFDEPAGAPPAVPATDAKSPSDSGVPTASAPPTYATTQAPPSSSVTGYVNRPTPEEEADAVLEVRRRVARLEDEVTSLAKLARKARSREAKLADRVRKLRASEDIEDRSKIEIINQQLVAAREASTDAEEARASSTARAQALRQTFGMSIAERASYLGGLGFGYLLDEGADQATRDEATAAALPGGTPATLPQTPDRLATDPTAERADGFVAYDRRSDTRYTPPLPTCSPAFDGVDEFTGKRRVALAPEVFFTYTSPELKPFLKSESLVTCEAWLTRTGKTTILETRYTIRSQFATKEFGVLPKGSQMTLRTVGGQRLTLKNQVQSQAEYDPVEKVSTYRGRYPLSRSAQKFLIDALLDEVRVMWGTGFDDYPLFDLAILQRQLGCLDQVRS